MLYREPFLHSRAEYAQLSLSEATEIQKSAVRYIQEITVTIPSEHVAILYNNPFINTCYYVAACCWISDLVEHSSTRGHGANHPFARARSLLATTAHSNFTACAKILRQFSQVWLGVGWIAAALAKRSQGLSLQDVIKTGVTDTILSEAEMVSPALFLRDCANSRRAQRMISGTSGDDVSITPQSGGADNMLHLPALDWNNVPDFSGAMIPGQAGSLQAGLGTFSQRGTDDFETDSGSPWADQPLWGAQGLFDEDMHALFMSINQQQQQAAT